MENVHNGELTRETFNFIYGCFNESEKGSSTSEDSTEERNSSESETSDSEISPKQNYSFHGVYFVPMNSRWVARGYVDGKQIQLASSHKSGEDCAELARKKVAELRSSGKSVFAEYGSPRVKSSQSIFNISLAFVLS